MIEKDTEGRCQELKRRLLELDGISIELVSSQIMKIGFRCLHCGECCFGDDCSVVVFPFEVRRIMAITREGWLETVEPPSEGEWDREGCFHTLEWRLRRMNGGCRFYAEKRCSIYEARPLLCRTYPFYLEDGSIRCSDCRGLGLETDPAMALQIASMLMERCRIEILEAMALLERYRDFERGLPGVRGNCIVHDSEGEHRISLP